MAIRKLNTYANFCYMNIMLVFFILGLFATIAQILAKCHSGQQEQMIFL